MRIVELVHSGALPTDALEELPVREAWHLPLAGDRSAVRLLVDDGDTERVTDRLRERFVGRDDYRVLVLPVEAVVPPLPPTPRSVSESASKIGSRRLTREELWGALEGASELTATFLGLAALSTAVACIGLVRNDVAIVIAAMVIAPLLGPNVALALATVLGSVRLGVRAATTGLAGMAVGLALAVPLGFVVDVAPTVPAIAARVDVGLSDVALALAAGIAAVLSFTTGAPGTLIGVMVAVALVPPLATCGLLLGAGHPGVAARAGLLVVTNLVCVNLAGVVTFMAQGVRPGSAWRVALARQGSWIALLLWALLLAGVVLVIDLVRRF